MKEIGGYFGLEEFTDNSMYSDLVAVNSARNALLYVLKARKIKKLFLPYYLLSDYLFGISPWPYNILYSNFILIKMFNFKK